MRVKCLKRFRDLKAGTFREEGAVFEVDDKRFSDINHAGYGQLVEKVEEKPSEAVSEPQKATSDKPAPKRRGRPKKTAEPTE